MPKKDKDRRSERDGGPGAGPAGGLGGDEDYDWIRYLGEGRAGAPSAPAPPTPAPPAARQTSLPKRSRPAAGTQGGTGTQGGSGAQGTGAQDSGTQDSGRFRRPGPTPATPGWNDSGGLSADQRSRTSGEWSRPADDWSRGGDRRSASSGLPARTDALAAGTSGSHDRPSGPYDRPSGPHGRPSGPHSRPAGRDAAPASGDYGRSPYSSQEEVWPTHQVSNEPWLDSAEYARPLYSDTGTIRAVGDRRSAAGGDRSGPAEAAWPTKALRSTDAQRSATPGRSGRRGRLGASPAGTQPGAAASDFADLPSREWPGGERERMSPGRTGPDWTGPGRKAAGRPGADWLDGEGPERGGSGLGRTGPNRIGPDRGKPEREAPGKKAVGKKLAGQKVVDRTTGGRTGVEQKGLDRQGIGRVKTARKGPGRQRSQQADRKVAGTATAGKRGGRLARAVTRLPRKVRVLGGLAMAAVLVLLVAVVFLLPQPPHVVTDPATLGSYVKQSALASATADQMKQKIVVGAAGEVKNVVAAVYERKSGPGTSNGPQIIAFVGGNLAGSASAVDLIGAMTTMHGSFTTNAGSLGGQAVCAPGANGGPAECTWADNDTFGVLVSATMTASALADQMRIMRPLVEHVAH